jgi:hypothetical protein
MRTYVIFSDENLLLFWHDFSSIPRSALLLDGLAGISFPILIHSRTDTRGFAKAKFEPEFEPEGPLRLKEPALPCIGQVAETGVFPNELSDTYPFAPYPSPTGDGSIAFSAHAPEKPPRQIVFRQQLPVVARVINC